MPGLPTDYWSHFYLFVDKGESLSDQFRGNVWPAGQVPPPQVVFVILDQDYSYKSIAIHTLQNARILIWDQCV